MALWSTVLLWDVVAIWRGEGLWWAFAYWSIALGLAFALPAMIAGVIDLLAIAAGSKAERVAAWHMMIMGAAASLFLVNLLIRDGPDIPQRPLDTVAVALSAGGLALLAVGGWLGGTLVYRFGVGREEGAAGAGSGP
jgi:uncharacterized membrane protein